MLYHVIPLPIPTACLRTTKTTFDCYKCLQFTTVPFELPFLHIMWIFFYIFQFFLEYFNFLFILPTFNSSILYPLLSIFNFQFLVLFLFSIFYFLPLNDILMNIHLWILFIFPSLSLFSFPFSFLFLLISSCLYLNVSLVCTRPL